MLNGLAGGCVMYRRENLVLDDFFPFEGKAYNEDLIHSFLLRNQGCRLILDSKAHCYEEGNTSSSYSLFEFLSNLAADYRARKYFAKLSSRSFFRMNLFYVAWFLSYFLKKIRLPLKYSHIR